MNRTLNDPCAWSKLSFLPFAAIVFASYGCTPGAAPSSKVQKAEAMKISDIEGNHLATDGGGTPPPSGVVTQEGAAIGLSDPDPKRPAQADGGKGYRPPIPATIWCVSLSPDGKRGLSTSGDTLTLWRFPKGEILRTMEAHPGDALRGDSGASGYEFSRTIGHLAVDWQAMVAVTGDYRAMMRAWNLNNGKLLWATQAHYHSKMDGGVSALAISPDGNNLYSSGLEPQHGAMIKVWDLRTGAFRWRVAFRDANSLAAVYERIIPLNDGAHVLLAGIDHLQLWDLRNDKSIWTLDDIERPQVIAATADGGRLLTFKEPHLVVRGRDRQEERVLMFTRSDAGGTGTCPTVTAFLDPDGKRALIGRANGDLEVWDVDAPKVLAQWKTPAEWNSGFSKYTPKIKSLAVMGDYRYALVGREMGFLELWDIEKGKLIRELNTPQTAAQDLE